LPKDAKMVCLELYADKTRLSSFGTEKGYPVMARILNLPVGIRNGDGIGGARVVGWLPVVRLRRFSSDSELTQLSQTQVDDAPEDKGRPTWVNFKRIIWHAAFFKLVESIEKYSAEGCWVSCGDGIPRNIYPLVLILAADYEEQ
jgi:Plavaka transposase